MSNYELESVRNTSRRQK